MKFSAALMKATSFGVGIGSGAIVSNLVKHTTPVGTNPLMRVAVGIGTLVVSNMVGDAASKYVERTVEETVADIKEAAEDIKKAKEEN